MKKVLVIGLIFVLLLNCSSCDIDPYEGKRPDDYPQTTWVCEEYNSYFLIGQKWELTEARIYINEQWYDFEFLWGAFDNSACIIVEMDGRTEELGGYCNFGKKKFEITLHDTKGYYPEEQITMVFVRTE